MLKKYSLVVLAIVLTCFTFFDLKEVYAYDLTVDGQLSVTNNANFGYPIYANGGQIVFGGGENRFINFNAGDSRIYDWGDLHVQTDDRLYFDFTDRANGVAVYNGKSQYNDNATFDFPIYASGNEIVFNNAGVAPKTADGTYRIYKSNDDVLRVMGPTLSLDITGTTSVQNSLSVGGSLTVNGLTDINNTLTVNSLTDGTATLTGGVLTSASGDISMWTGVLPDVQLSDNVTKQGNNFNTANELVQLDGLGYLPAINGSDLIGLTKSQVGLSNVENTAISTWGGSVNLTTLGNVTTGYWSASAIEIAHGGTGHSTQTSAFDALSPLSATGDLIYFNGTNNVRLGAGSEGDYLTLASGVPAWASPTTLLSISVLTAAANTNTINNGNYAQIWDWSLTSANTSGLTFGENVASTATGITSIVKATTLAGSTAIPLYVKNLGDGDSFRVDDETLDTSLFLINKNGNVAVGSDFFDPTAPEKFKVDAGATTSYNIISGYGDVNNYLQMNIKNRNAGTLASSDVVATADNGTESNYFVNMGIASSNYNHPTYSFFWAK